MATGGRSDGTLDPGGIDELDGDECWRLLATQQVGRFAVMVGQYPLVFPVNYAVDGRTIVFRTAPGTKLAAVERCTVTFEVDVVTPPGWSVMVHGLASELIAERNVDVSERSKATGATPWAPGDRTHIVRVVPDHVTGRRIRPAELPDAFDARGYP
jgi:nitroimidazol reductase NimA-like FMN-containing flavoprotein (pyridoxamine 5'-phosphate oxidase superfamily)